MAHIAKMEKALEEASGEYTRKVILVGNPGSGKSTLINCVLGENVFNSGLSSDGNGVTFQLDVKDHNGVRYCDTPGLSDAFLRKQAAAAIDEALQEGGEFQVCFVVTLRNNRIQPDDLTTIKLVLEAANQIPANKYSIIINQMQPRHLKRLDKEAFLENLKQQVETGKSFVQATDNVHFVEQMDELDGEQNAITTLPKETMDFFSQMPRFTIEKNRVQDVNSDGFDDMMSQISEAEEQARLAKIAKEHAEKQAEAERLAKEKAEEDARLAKAKAVEDARIAKAKAVEDARIAKAKADEDARIAKAKADEEIRKRNIAKEQAEKQAETARIAKEKAENDARIAKEKAENDARIAKAKADEDARIARVKAAEDARIASVKAASDARIAKEKADREVRLAKEKAAEDARVAIAAAKRDAAAKIAQAAPQHSSDKCQTCTPHMCKGPRMKCGRCNATYCSYHLAVNHKIFGSGGHACTG